MQVLTGKPARRELDTYVCKRPLRGIHIRQAAVADVIPLVERAHTEITGELADKAHIWRVIDHNNECIWVVERTMEDGCRRRVGFHAFLPLSAEGEAALLCSEFGFAQPDLRHIATARETPSALYWWASLGTGTSATAITLIMERLKTPRYRCLDIYSRPATLHGALALLNAGFRPLFGGADPIGSIVIYRRLVNRAVADRPRLN